MNLGLNLLPLFLAMADSPSFRIAADRLGVTRSAVSQGMRRLEDGVGTALVTRTTRSVHLTETGERLRAALASPYREIGDALENAASETSPRGLLRVAVASIAERILSGPLIAGFTAAYPNVSLDVTVTNEAFDIIERGFDAGIRLGEVIEQDMIAVPITGTQREMAVASPAYLTGHGAPDHPRDLIDHRCIGWRPTPEAVPYRWEFVEDGVPFDVAVQPQVTTNDLRLMLRTALADGGITFAPEETFRTHLENGDLIPLLEDYLPPFTGFHIYFPQRRHMALKLRAFVDHVRWGGSG